MSVCGVGGECVRVCGVTRGWKKVSVYVCEG